MAFADPQSVTVNSVPNSLPRVSSGTNSATYQTASGDLKLSVSHQYGKRTRRQIRLDNKKIAPDVFTSDNMLHSMSVYLVVDQPTAGYTLAELKQLVEGLLAHLTGSDGASLAKFLGGEN